MARRFTLLLGLILGLLAVIASAPAQEPGSLGIFEGQSDVGSVTPPGTAVFDSATHVYTVTSAGANMWSATDAFHFVWKKVSGDLVLTADIAFPSSAGNPNEHRKAALIFRQALDADGVYADAALHGSGMTALQYRRTVGATTQDIELNIEAPSRLRLEKRGDVITLFLSSHGEPLHQVGTSIKLHFADPFYAGLGVCSHNKDAVETAAFSNVELAPLTAPAAPGAAQSLQHPPDHRNRRQLPPRAGCPHRQGPHGST